MTTNEEHHAILRARVRAKLQQQRMEQRMGYGPCVFCGRRTNTRGRLVRGHKHAFWRLVLTFRLFFLTKEEHICRQCWAEGMAPQ